MTWMADPITDVVFAAHFLHQKSRRFNISTCPHLVLNMDKTKEICHRMGFNVEDSESPPSIIIAELKDFAMSVKQGTYKNIEEMVRGYLYFSGPEGWILDSNSIPMLGSWLGQDLDHEEYVREFIQSDLHILTILVPRSSSNICSPA